MKLHPFLTLVLAGEWSAFRLDRFVPGERDDAHRIAACGDHQSRTGNYEKEKNLVPLQGPALWFYKNLTRADSAEAKYTSNNVDLSQSTFFLCCTFSSSPLSPAPSWDFKTRNCVASSIWTTADLDTVLESFPVWRLRILPRNPCES
jgi:hypothetical protein